MNKQELVINIEDIYYTDDEDNRLCKKLLNDDKSNCCYKLFNYLLCYFQ